MAAKVKPANASSGAGSAAGLFSAALTAADGTQGGEWRLGGQTRSRRLSAPLVAFFIRQITFTTKPPDYFTTTGANAGCCASVEGQNGGWGWGLV